MSHKQFCRFLDEHQVVLKSNGDAKEEVELGKQLPIPVCVRDPIKMKSHWSQMKPFASSKVQKLVVNDLDDLVPPFSRNFNPNKLEWCKIHDNTPPGLSLYLPEHAWAIQKSTLGDKVKSESELDASEHANTPSPVQATATSGYCECCGIIYQGSLAYHCKSSMHCSFLSDDNNFIAFDTFVHQLRSREAISLPSPSIKPLHVSRSCAKLVEPSKDFDRHGLELECSLNSEEPKPKKVKREWLPPPRVSSIPIPRSSNIESEPKPRSSNIDSCGMEWEETYLENEPHQGIHIGKSVMRTIDCEESRGKVTGCRLQANGRWMYDVVYVDGDMEEMSSEEVIFSSCTQINKSAPICFQTAKSVQLQRQK